MRDFNLSTVLRSPKVINAFEEVDRKDFVRPAYVDCAYDDTPLPIEYGQTISQPSTVAFMLELLELEEGLKVLDVGSGSGWTTALLARIVGKNGEVIGIELIPELVSFGRKNIAKYCNGSNASIFPAGKIVGYPSKAPYDRILVSAGADEVPSELIQQLKVGGILVIPVKNSLYKLVKNSSEIGGVQKEEYPGFVFVPLKE